MSSSACSSSGGSSRTEWPQSLKDFANRVFQTCNDSNRRMVSEELKTIIFQSFQAGTINTTDWSSVRLKSLGDAGAAQSTSTSTKKGKKRFLGAVTSLDLGSDDVPTSSGSNTTSRPNSASGPGSNDDEKRREKRARRFEQEQKAYNAEQESNWSAVTPYSTTSLAGRLGGTSLGSSSGTKKNGNSKKDGWQNEHAIPAWTYDPAPSIGNASRAGWSSTVDSRSGLAVRPVADESMADPNVMDWDVDTVVGLSTKLEKPYLRLTSAPDPKTVRPLLILQQTLELLKKKWREESNYAYVCDQFKSMRQDLTVQRIKNNFTVKVYEIHARIALEKGDLGEYNQCQSQLRTLYTYSTLQGSRMEFLAYRILYLLHTRNRREVNALMTELTSTSKKEAAVAHALSVRLALATGNYHHFFKLWSDAPNMNAYIIDHFVERERVAALGIIAKSYRPSIPLTHIAKELAFTDVGQAHDFLKTNDMAIYIDPTPAELAASQANRAPSMGSASQGKSSGKSLPLQERRWDCRAALPGLLAAGQKYRMIDIKGQI